MEYIIPAASAIVVAKLIEQETYHPVDHLIPMPVCDIRNCKSDY